jgi:hypothetical protein
MRSKRRTFRGRSVLPKTQRNYAFLLGTSFTTLWRSKIHSNLTIDADADVAFLSAVNCMISIKASECSVLVSAPVSTVYAVRRIKKENETNLTNCTSNLT